MIHGDAAATAGSRGEQRHESTDSFYAEGYDIEFRLQDGHLRCDADDRTCPCGDAVVERLYRFEGPSDPGDEMVVFGLRDPESGRRGHLASGFGPAADPEIMDHLAGMASRFDR